MAWYDHVMKRYTYNREAQVSPKDIKTKRAGIVFVPSGASGTRGQFEEAPVDFSEISDAWKTDGYIRQALDKYVYLMFKEGYVITSKNQKASEYIKRRLALMAACTGIPTDEMFMEFASTLVRDANVFIIKARQDLKFKPNGIQIKPVQNMGKPVAGYFVQNTSTVTIMRDTSGTVLKYKIKVTGVEEKEIKPEDMIHIYYDKEPGQAFAVPFVWEVLNDVKLLRTLEEIVARMVYKEVFPLRDVAVGSDEEGKYATKEEIDDAKEVIDNMSEDGWFVHGGHMKLNVLGGQGEALNAEPYLRYYESRVFSGLGVSAVMMGRGEGASRSTADNMTDQMYDRILGFQAILENNISNKMFLELLLEGGFDPINNTDDMVYLDFCPVDRNQLIRDQLHQLQLFQGNMKGLNEARAACKFDPVTDLSDYYSNLFKIPEITAQAKAQAEVSSESGNGIGSDKSVGNKNQPANQSGKKIGPSRAKNSESKIYEKVPSTKELYEYADKQYEFIREDLLQYLKSNYGKSRDSFEKSAKLILNLSKINIINQANKALLNSLVYGIETTRYKINPYEMPMILYTEAMVRINDTFSKDLDRLINDIERLSLVSFDADSEINAITKLNSSLDSIKYRLSFIVCSDATKAYNYGIALCCKSYGKEYVKVKADCPKCQDIYKDLIPLTGDFYNAIPPSAHPNCECELEVV